MRARTHHHTFCTTHASRCRENCLTDGSRGLDRRSSEVVAATESFTASARLRPWARQRRFGVRADPPLAPVTNATGDVSMAYLFSLSGTNAGEPRSALDPFTGKPAMMPTFVMNDEERAAVHAVITRHGGTLQAGTGALSLPGAEMSFEDLGGPRSRVSIEGAIEPAIAVLFEIATAGRLLVINIHEKCDEPVPVVTTPEAHARTDALEEAFGAPELETDVGRFLRLLLPGYDRMRGPAS